MSSFQRIVCVFRANGPIAGITIQSDQQLVRWGLESRRKARSRGEAGGLQPGWSKPFTDVTAKIETHFEPKRVHRQEYHF